MDRETHSLTALLAEQAASFRFEPPFTAIGTPGLLATNERTPEGFYSNWRQSAEPNGYVFGAGCGNIIAMVEAFSGMPRGLICADVDPAVVCAGRMFVACLEKNPDAEGFARQLFCSGEQALVELENEVLTGSDPFEIAQQMEIHRPRLRASLRQLTKDFSLGPEDARELVASWRKTPEDRNQPIPVRHFVVRNYGKLHRLARAGSIALVQASIFEPSLLDAISQLPHFAASRNVAYMSNAVDHMLRRGLLLSARTELGLSDGQQQQPVFGSIQEFVEYLNQELCKPLKSLTTGAEDIVFVHSTSGRDLRLTWQTTFPEFVISDFNIRFDLRKMILGFFESFVRSADAPPVVETDAENPWLDAGRMRAKAFDLYLATVLGDPNRARSALSMLQSLLQDATGLQPSYLAYCCTEICHAALTAQRSQLAAELAGSIVALQQQVDSVLQQIPAGPRGDCHMENLLHATAHDIGRHFCGVDAAARLDHKPSQWLQEVPNGQIGVLAECVWRSLVQQIHHPDRRSANLSRGIEAIMAAITPHGAVSDVVNQGELPVSDYLNHVTRHETMYDNLRLALLFGGLWLETAEPIEVALRVNHYAQQKQHSATAPRQTSALLEQLHS